IHLVLGCAPGGDLYTQLTKQNTGRFDEATAARYVSQFVGALDHIRNEPVIHRDIKPEIIHLASRPEASSQTLDAPNLQIWFFDHGMWHTVLPEPRDGCCVLWLDDCRKLYAGAIDQWSLGILR
ncbi:hypothetical protein DE146DRAFT_619714, partial [Phaeosphaeria sp. MPI-PUGE-AT-0046c]